MSDSIYQRAELESVGTALDEGICNISLSSSSIPGRGGIRSSAGGCGQGLVGAEEHPAKRTAASTIDLRPVSLDDQYIACLQGCPCFLGLQHAGQFHALPLTIDSPAIDNGPRHEGGN